MTALTLYGSKIASGTLAAAGTLASATGGVESGTSTAVLSSTTGTYLEIWGKGTATAQNAVMALPAPTGNGWLFDTTTLEGQTMAAGNWTPTVSLSNTFMSLTGVTIYVRFYKRSSGGVYTAIGTASVTGKTITTSRVTFAVTAASLAATSFGVGDKLYVDLFLYAAANWGGSTYTVSTYESSTASGVASDMQIVTPGYVSSMTRLASGRFHLTGTAGLFESDTGVRGTTNAGTWGTATDGNAWVLKAGSSAGISTTMTQLQINAAGIFMTIGASNGLSVVETVRFTINAAGDGPIVFLRYTDTNNYIKCDYTGGLLRIRKNVAGVLSNVVTAPFTPTTGVPYWLKFQVSGTTYSIRAWLASGADPDTWMASGTAADSVLSSGFWGLGATSAGQQVQYDTFSIQSPLTRVFGSGRAKMSVGYSGRVLANDTFNRTVAPGTNWGTASDGQTWVALGSSTYTLSVNGTTATIATGGTGPTFSRLGSTQPSDAQITAKVTLGASGDYVGLNLRCDATGNNRYYWMFTTSGSITLYKRVAGVQTNLGSASPFPFVAGTAYQLRFQVLGTTLSGKIWVDGTLEPFNWTKTVTDASVTGPGYMALYTVPVSTTPILIDDFLVTEASTLPLEATGRLKMRVSRTLQGMGRLAIALRRTAVSQGRTAIRAPMTRFAQGRLQLAAGQRLLSMGRAKIRASFTRLAAARFSLVGAHRFLASGRASLQVGKRLLSAGRLRLVVAQRLFARGRLSINVSRRILAQGRVALRAIQTRFAAGRFALQTAFPRTRLAQGRTNIRVAFTRGSQGRVAIWIATHQTRLSQGRVALRAAITRASSGRFSLQIAFGQTRKALGRLTLRVPLTRNAQGRAAIAIRKTMTGMGRAKLQATGRRLAAGRLSLALRHTLASSGRTAIRASHTLAGAGRFALILIGGQRRFALGRVAMRANKTRLAAGRFLANVRQTRYAAGRARISARITRLASGRVGLYVPRRMTAMGRVALTIGARKFGMARFKLALRQTYQARARVAIAAIQRLFGTARFRMMVRKTANGQGRAGFRVQMTRPAQGRAVFQVKRSLFGGGRIALRQGVAQRRFASGRAKIRAGVQRAAVARFLVHIVQAHASVGRLHMSVGRRTTGVGRFTLVPTDFSDITVQGTAGQMTVQGISGQMTTQGAGGTITVQGSEGTLTVQVQPTLTTTALVKRYILRTFGGVLPLWMQAPDEDKGGF